MSLIEGVGDEVTVFASILLLVTLILVAWISTHVADRPLASVIILDRRNFQEFIRRLRQRNVNVISTPEAEPADISVTESSTSVTTTPEGDPDGILTETTTITTTTITTETTESDDFTVEDGQIESETAVVTESEIHENITESRHSQEHLVGSCTPTNDGNEYTEHENPDEQQLRQRRVAFFDSKSESRNNAVASEITNTQTCDDNQPTDSYPASDRTTSIPPPGGEFPNLIDGYIRIKLKYLNDDQRWVHARPDETVGNFKREHFIDELTRDVSVRFIHNGRELRDPLTLQSYNIVDTSVIHCLISQTTTTQQTTVTTQLTNQLEIGNLMFPLFGVILVLIWYCRVMYRIYFSAMSTFTLIGITFLYAVAVLGSWRLQRLQGVNHDHYNS